MASVSSLYSLLPRPPICHYTALSINKAPPTTNSNSGFYVLGSISPGTKHNVLYCKNSEYHQEPCFGVEERCGAKRREVVLQMTIAAFSFPAIIGNALAENDVPENFRVYSDDVNKFKILIPQDWQVGAGEPNGFKSITAFYPEGATSSNVSVVITGLGADFTKMESFGKVDAFAETLVNGLDRSWQRPAGVAAKLIDCRASKGNWESFAATLV
uniref:PsbP C-terminal domain-containing protein n=1 Tax=Fagus sylvatica TaxID=28930 RepID=A0A2N9ITX2_FAGSY